SSAGASGLSRDTSRSWVSGGVVGPASGKGASTTGASAAETPARPKAVSREPGSTGSVAGSGRSRWDVVTAATEATACGRTPRSGPAAGPANGAPPGARRCQTAVAGFSIPGHSKPPTLAAPATPAVAHNSASANRRGLPIARLPPFGYPKAGRTAGTRLG